MADEYESFELEYSEDDIVYYLYDEKDQEIGFVIEQDGEEVELYYEWVDSDAYAAIEAEEPEGGEGADAGMFEEEDVDFEAGDVFEEAEHASLADLDGEVVEMEISEEDIDHYLFDEDGNEIGFVVIEDGVEVECYYEEEDEADEDEADGEGDGEVVELEIDEDDIDHYLFDEDGNEIGFVIIEDGTEIECYYEEDEDSGGEDEEPPASASEPARGAGAADEPEEPEEHGYLYKMAQIAGHEGNKARKKAGQQLDKARKKAEPAVSQARAKAEEGIDKATEAVESGGKKLKEKSDEYDLGITREDVATTTADLNALAKEGAATAKELKEAYDDIMDSFGFFMPKSVRRKLP